MTWGNFGAASGAQPAAGQPTGVQPFAPGQVGQPPGQAGATLPPCYGPQDSILAAVSRGEVSLNQRIANNDQFGGNNATGQNAAGNPTLLQAISQGNPQNGTNGIGVDASYANCNKAPGTLHTGGTDTTATLDPKAPAATLTTSQLISPIQYGGG